MDSTSTSCWDFLLTINVHIIPSEQERTRCILDETQKIEKQSLREAQKSAKNHLIDC